MRIFLFAVAVLATGLSQLPSDPALAAGTSPRPQTETSADELDGVIKPFEMIAVGSPTSGLLAQVNVEAGDRVTAGQVLARLDSQVERQSAELARLKAESSAELDIAKVKVASAKEKLAKRKKLVADGIVTQEEYDAALTEMTLTDLDLSAALESAALARVEYQKAQALVARTDIKAPADAVVLLRTGSEGEVVTSSPDSSIFTLARLDPLRVEVRAPVAWLADLKLGQTAIVMPTFDDSLHLEATITVIDAVADAASETVRVELELPNPDLALPAGIRCRVQLER